MLAPAPHSMMKTCAMLLVGASLMLVVPNAIRLAAAEEKTEVPVPQ